MKKYLKVNFLLSLLAILVMQPVVKADSAISCEEAKTWADSQTSLPTTLEDFSKLHLVYRREVFRRLSGGQRVALWNAHLDTFKDILNREQTKTLNAIRGLLTVENFSDGKKEVVGLPSIAELKKIFNTPAQPNLVQQMFGVLGSWDNEEQLAFLPKTSPKKAASRAIASNGGGGGPVPVNPGAPGCGCSQSHNLCPSGFEKGTEGSCDGGGCTTSSWGCGPLWLYSCDGSCN